MERSVLNAFPSFLPWTVAAPVPPLSPIHQLFPSISFSHPSALLFVVFVFLLFRLIPFCQRCIGYAKPTLTLLSFVFLLGLAGCNRAAEPEPEGVETAIANPTVVAVGRLGPVGGVIKLSVPNAADSRVNQILVREGDRVEAGQVIAVLQGAERRERDLAEAQQNVALFEARLAQVEAGTAKQAEIAAQRSNIVRLEADLRTQRIEKEAAIAAAEADRREAQLTFDRQAQLAKEGAISDQALDQARQVLDNRRAIVTQRQAQLANTEQTLEQQVAIEQQNLSQLQEVRPVDVQVARAELERARLAVEQRQADLADTQVKVPIPGQILRINTKVGEQVNTQQGIVELGLTEQMFARAEVYETEVGKIQEGQRATIVSEYGGFEGELQGTVDQIGLQIGAPQLQQSSTNPTNDENTRVVAVDIRIDEADSERVAALTNMQVRVEIDVSD